MFSALKPPPLPQKKNKVAFQISQIILTGIALSNFKFQIKILVEYHNHRLSNLIYIEVLIYTKRFTWWCIFRGWWQIWRWERWWILGLGGDRWNTRCPTYEPHQWTEHRGPVQQYPGRCICSQLCWSLFSTYLQQRQEAMLSNIWHLAELRFPGRVFSMDLSCTFPNHSYV